MKRLLLLAGCIVFVLTTLAKKVSEQEAFLKAQNFMQNKHFTQNSSSQRKKLRRASQQRVTNNPYYIFNAEDNCGWVIVSGDDRTEEILGYSEQGQLLEGNMPENLQVWLQGYQEQISLLKGEEIQRRLPIQRSPIGAMIKTKWNQRWPYNTMCPMDGENQCVTGCVATAMAQIMYYHRWPQTYDWDNMLLDYLSESTKEQQNAVAKLMSDCGVAVNMNYSATSSSASLNPNCLKEMFGYCQTAILVDHDNYTNTTWEDMIYAELAAGRPVYYRGAKAVPIGIGFDVEYAGHAFICDGYDGEGLFHFNWGWGGMCDGYFVLSLANPSQSGIGGSDVEGGYSFNQKAIIGIQPKNGTENSAYLMASDYSYNATEYNRSSISESFADINISTTLHCYVAGFSGQLGYGLFKGNTMIAILEGTTESAIEENEETRYSQTVSFGANLEDGKYFIRAIYKATGDDNWKVCKEYNYLSITINGLSLNIGVIDKYTQKIKVNSVTINGNPKEGRILKTTINITNEGETAAQDIIITLGNTSITTHTNLEPEETTDIDVNIPLKEHGEQTMIITCDGNQLWSEQVTIEECPEYDFAGLVNVEGLVMGRLWHQGFINGNTVKGSVTLTNNSSVTYDDDIIVRLSSKFPVREQLIHVILEPRETKTIDFEIDDLVNERYSFDILYYSRNGNEYLGGYLKYITQNNAYLPTLVVGFDSFYNLSGSYTINGLKITDRSEDGTNLNGNIPYTTIEGSLAITNHSARTYDDNVVLSFGNEEEYPNYKRNDTYHLMLPPGATEVIDFKYDGLEWIEGDLYHLTANYNPLSGNNTDFNGKNVLAAANVKMFREHELLSKFVMKSHFANEKKKYLKDDKLKFSIEITNPLDYVFQKKINVSIIKAHKGTWFFDDRDVIINPHETITLDYEYDVEDDYYMIDAAYLADELNMGSLGGGTWQFVDDSYVELGDINADGFVDNADIEPLMDKILEKSDDKSSFEPGRLFQKDRDYTISDLVVLISKINGQILMGENLGGPVMDCVWAESDSVKVGRDNVIPIMISTEEGKYSAVSFTISMPNGCRIKNDENGIPMVSFIEDRNTDHRVYCKWQESKNKYNIIVYSPTNAKISGTGELVQMTVEVDSVFTGDKIIFDWATRFSEVGGNVVNDYYYQGQKVCKLAVIKPSIITAKSYIIEYGDEMPDFGYEKDGYEIEGVPEITCSATTESPVGVYPICITKGTIFDDYVTYVNGTLTIVPAPLNIAAGTYTKKQGDAMPEFTLTYTGFKNNETKDVLTKQPETSCNATEASAPGEYPVAVSGAEAQNYEISYTAGKLVVTEADLVTITAKNYTRVYGEDNPTFEFTAEGATLEGTPQISCEATAESPVGTYDIVVSQGTVSNYNVSYVAGTLTVIKAPLTISADTYTKKQGEAMPEFVLTYDGFKNNETKDVLTKQPIVSCEATEASAPGEYPVIVSGAEAQNYDISYTNGKLVVVDADAVVVKAKNYTREYGEDNPLFEFTTEGATLEGTPQISCEATATSPVGTYNIVIGQGTVSNYNVSYVAGTLTITKAPLIIAADTYTKKQGEAMPEFTLTYTGFKNNETKDVLTKLPTVSCEATEASAPGEYPVIVSGAEAHNYDISYTNGKLIVVDADAVIVKAKSYTREYGEDNPTFEYTVEGAELVGEPIITCEATATSPAGTYDIVVSQGTVSNFNVSYIAGTLTITKAPLTITAGTYTKKQYDPMPEFKVSYDGFKNNETELVLTKQPVISCEANEESSPGEYDIVVGGAEALNYEIQYVSGKLTVTEPDSYSLTYIVDGEEYKSFTVKYRETITPLNAPEREGYTFSGWSDIPATMPANDVVVTGTFTVNTYAVTFMYNDKVLKVDSVEYGAVIPLPTSLNSDCYTLIEWLDVPETMPAHDITIYASVVDGILTLTDEVDYKIYNERGLRISRLQRGLNIIKYSNGRIRKVIVK